MNIFNYLSAIIIHTYKIKIIIEDISINTILMVVLIIIIDK